MYTILIFGNGIGKKALPFTVSQRKIQTFIQVNIPYIDRLVGYLGMVHSTVQSVLYIENALTKLTS